jgi:hypothetical protein
LVLKKFSVVGSNRRVSLCITLQTYGRLQGAASTKKRICQGNIDEVGMISKMKVPLRRGFVDYIFNLILIQFCYLSNDLLAL